MDKENRELKASLEQLPSLVAENERLKNDLEMTRQRLTLVEKQLKKLPGPSGVVAAPVASEGSPNLSEDKTTTAPPKANVKPIAAPVPPLRPLMPTASIRPMSQGLGGRPGTSKTTASVTPTASSGQMPQVSTSTPENSGVNVMTIPVTSSVTSGTLRQATVPPIVTNVATVHAQPQMAPEGPSSDSVRPISSDPQPSTSETSEMTSDSSEQVSSSEPHITTGTVQPMLSVAPLRSEVAPGGSAILSGPSTAGIVGSEEQPSSTPSSSVLQQRATQSSVGAKKRPRGSIMEVKFGACNFLVKKTIKTTH